MTNENNRRYGTSKNLWRKTYGYQNNKPRIASVVDAQTQETYSLDLNKTLRHRDYFIIKDIIFSPTVVEVAEYDEGLVLFSSIADSGVGTFNFSFSNTPIVVLTVESASLYGDNLNIYGLSLSQTGFTFGLSALFTGSIRYRAIYSPTYYAYATSSYTASITASAGTTRPAGVDYYTASFNALPGTPFSFLDTAWDFFGIQDVDVALQTQASSSNAATVEISSPMSSSIHFIAFY